VCLFVWLLPAITSQDRHPWDWTEEADVKSSGESERLGVSDECVRLIGTAVRVSTVASALCCLLLLKFDDL